MAEATTHRVEITFDDGVYIKLICPEDGCVPAEYCAQCGRHVTGPSGEGCYDCKDGYGEECWVKGWVENMTAEELLHGKITLPVNPSFDGECCILDIGTGEKIDA